MPNQTFHLFQPRIKYGVACDGFDPTFRVRWIVMCIWEERNILLDFLLFSIFPLSSPSAHSEMSGFCWTPPKKKRKKEDNISLREPNANSEEKRQGTRRVSPLYIKFYPWVGLLFIWTLPPLLKKLIGMRSFLLMKNICIENLTDSWNSKTFSIFLSDDLTGEATPDFIGDINNSSICKSFT